MLNKDFQISTASGQSIALKQFDILPYQHTVSAMQEFAANRAADSQDEIWLLQHPPVYTQGTACLQTPLLPSDIELVKTDRGGQITYHGPGQIVMYPLLKLKNYRLGVKKYVHTLEQAVIDFLAQHQLSALRRDGAPGVYIEQAKIAALGLRVRRGTSYHGLSLNVDMDLSPFDNIDPCGYQGLRVTQLKSLLDKKVLPDFKQLQLQLLQSLIDLL